MALERNPQAAMASVPVTQFARTRSHNANLPLRFAIRSFDADGFPVKTSYANDMQGAALAFVALARNPIARHVTLSISREGSRRGHLLISRRVR